MFKEKNELLYLTERDVKASGLSMGETVELIETVFKADGEGEALVPAKISLDLRVTGKYSSVINAMPAYVGPMKICGIKWTGMNFSNPKKRGLPSVIATIILTDPESSMPIAILSANWITAMRTGAATAVGAKYLARRNSKKVCIIGAGYNGRFQLKALNEVLNIDEVRIADINKEARDKYAVEMGEALNLDVASFEDLKEAVKGTDVIVTATNADEPLIQKEWVNEGCFISSIGSYQELDIKILKSFNKIVVDHLEQTKHRGELAKWYEKGLILERDIYSTLGDVVSGRYLGREKPDENILLVPIGIGSEDVATAFRIYQLSQKKGLGKKLDYLA